MAVAPSSGIMLPAPADTTPGVARSRSSSVETSVAMCSAFAAPFGALTVALSYPGT